MAKEFMPLNRPKTASDMRNTSRDMKAKVVDKKTPGAITNERPVIPGFAGFNKPSNGRGQEEKLPSTKDIKPASTKDIKPASTKDIKPASTKTEKPITDTSGTANANAKKEFPWFEKIKKQVAFGQKFGGHKGAHAGAMGLPFYKRMKTGGTMMVVDPVSQTVNFPGSKLPRTPKPTTPAKPPTDTGGGGIDAPAPDTGWRPSGVNSASGLQQKTMGVALQERVGVTKRRR